MFRKLLSRWFPLEALWAWFPLFKDMRPIRVIVISRDYSVFPGARYESQGKNSGERFATEILIPAFQQVIDRHERLIVDLDGTNGYSCDFLDESFTRLISRFGLPKVKSVLTIRSTEEPSLIAEIDEYMLAAEYHRVSH